MQSRFLSPKILKHLEGNNTYARLLFVDFSSTFNSIHPDILLNKMAGMKVNPFIIRWYYSFLSNRQQQVRINSVLSDKAVSSTGAPQGTVSSSLLFTLYTNDCVSPINMQLSSLTTLSFLVYSQVRVKSVATQTEWTGLWVGVIGITFKLTQRRQKRFW